MFPSSIPNSKKIKNQEELHRRAYNASFDFYGLKIAGTPLVWSVEYYDILANTVGGGKPKMKFHFGENRWPVGADFFDGAIPNGEDEQNQLVDALQDKKTEFYKEIVASTATARPGRYQVRGYNSFNHRLPTFDDLTFVPATMTRLPLEGYREKCETKTVLGGGRGLVEKPIELDIPIYIASMSFGALSASAKEALGHPTQRIKKAVFW